MIRTIPVALLELLSLAVLGCARVTVPAHPLPSPQKGHEAIESPVATAWKPQLVPGTYSYIIHDSALISVGSDTTHTVPIETTTYLSLEIERRDDSIHVKTRVDSAFRIADQRISKDTTVFTEPVYSYSLTGHAEIVATIPTINCTTARSAVESRIPELLPSYPIHSIRPGDQWSDTISTSSCRGKTQLSKQNIREFQLVDLDRTNRQNFAQVHKSVTVNIQSVPTVTANALKASGTGSSSGIFYIDLSTGMVLESISHSESSFTVTTTRGVFPFTQTVYTKIKREN